MSNPNKQSESLTAYQGQPQIRKKAKIKLDPIVVTLSMTTFMASSEQVKQYLAYWFQLGKKVWLRNGQESLLPEPVIQGQQYSAAFEQCWQRLLDPNNGDCYLEGTEYTIQDLLSSEWEMIPCARCQLPVALKIGGMECDTCPCSDLSNWPNLDIPLPRIPINNSEYLRFIRHKLLNIQ